MKLARFFKIFPVPKSLELPKVGLDISDESIKFAELIETPAGYRLGKFGQADLPVGTIVAGKIVNKENLIQVLSKIKKENKFSCIHASLPEEETFVVRMNIPKIEKKELRNSILLQLENYIPLPADKAVFDYEIYSKPETDDGHYVLGVFAASEELSSGYTDALTLAGLNPISLEIEVQSEARALIPASDHDTHMIVDFGRTRTGFSIVSRGIVLFTSTIKSIGGENLTKAVIKTTGLDFAEAEKAKIKQGLINSPANKSIFEALLPIASLFKDEVSRHYNYWESLRESGEMTAGIKSIILCGGEAQLPGLLEYISANFPTPVVLGNPWCRFLNIGQSLPPMDAKKSLSYSTAIGLALRGANPYLL